MVGFCSSKRVLIAGAILLFLWLALWYNTPVLRSQPKFQQSKTFERVKRNVSAGYYLIGPVEPPVAWTPVIFHIKPQSRGLVTDGQTTFRGEVTHANELSLLDIQHVGNDSYTATFLPSFNGVYKIEVFITYVNNEYFNYTAHVRARMIQLEGSPLHLAVDWRAPPEHITRRCSQWESGTARGRWVRCGSMGGIEKCAPWQLVLKFDFDNVHGFFWLPYFCQLHQYTNFEMKTCLARNGWDNIVLTGDSHSRFRTYHWATRLYGQCENCTKTEITTRFDLVPKLEWVFDARGTRWATTFPNITRPNEIYVEHENLRSMFSHHLSKTATEGDLYVINFGHWLLREITFKEFMAQKLRVHIEAVKLMNVSKLNKSGKLEKQKRFIWVNTLSPIWREDHYVYLWRTNPCPAVTRYLNSVFDRAMSKAGMQVVDAFQVSSVRLRASWDKTHYAKTFPDNTCGGVVENAVTNLILNALCTDSDISS